MKNKVSFESSTDGVFWMEVLDFVQQYSFAEYWTKMMAGTNAT